MVLQSPRHVVPCLYLSHLIGVLQALNSFTRHNLNLLCATAHRRIVGRCCSANSCDGSLAGSDGDDALAVGSVVGHTAVLTCHCCELRSQFSIDNGIVVLAVGGNDRVVAALVVAYGVLKAEEAQLRAFACYLVGNTTLYGELKCFACLFGNGDAVVFCQGRSTLQHIEGLVGVQHDGHGNLTVFRRLEDVGSAAAAVGLSVDAIASSIGSVALNRCVGVFVVCLAGKAEGHRDVCDRRHLRSRSKIAGTSLKGILALCLCYKRRAGQSH